jgi:hypothetical protein
VTESRSAYSVASFKPFWRYAVALDGRPDLPGIPYYSKAGALAFFEESVSELPWERTVLLRKRLFRRVVTVVGEPR